MTLRRAAGITALTAGLWLLATSLPFSPPPGSDINLYDAVAGRMASGEMPYRDFFFEYPPGAAIAIWLTRYIPLPYANAFSLVVCLAVVATAFAAMAVASSLGFDRRRRALVVAAVAITPLAVGRYIAAERLDLLLSAAIAVMLMCAVTRRFGWAWVMLGVAVLIKLVPVLLVPLLILWQLRVRPSTLRRDGAIGAGVVAAVALPFVVASPSGVWSSLEYHLSRPLQIESLGASYMRLIAVLTDRPMDATFGFGSHNLETSGADVVAAISTFAQLGCIAVIVVACHRMATGDNRVFVGAIATTMAVIVLGAKVLSPQFVLWVVPGAFLVAGVYGSFAMATALAVLLVTQLEYPSAYFALVDGDPSAVGLLVIRNALLITLVAACWPRRAQTAMSNGATATASPSGPASTSAP